MKLRARPSLPRRHYLVLLLAVFSALVCFLWGIPILDVMELKTYDLRFLSRGPLQPAPEIVLAVIDQKSLDREGRWPWPRSKMASLVDILSQSGSRVIGFDIGFLESEEDADLALMDELDRALRTSGVDHETLSSVLDRYRKDANQDAQLAHAIAGSAAPVVLGYFFHTSHQDIPHRPQTGGMQDDLDRI